MYEMGCHILRMYVLVHKIMYVRMYVRMYNRIRNTYIYTYVRTVSWYVHLHNKPYPCESNTEVLFHL